MKQNQTARVSTPGRITPAFLTLLQIFIESPNQMFTGAEVRIKSKLQSGTVYPLLSRMEKRGWLTYESEYLDDGLEEPTKRRLYKVTGGGIKRGRQILADMSMEESVDMTAAQALA